VSQHGDYDQQQQRWYCGYRMTQQEWLDIHDYAPPTLQQQEDQPEEDEK